MQSIAVRQGDVVAEGAVIGTVGATGYVRKSGGDGSHLHFEVRDHGRSCNPFYFLK
jgi:murein DD-endopeptidase MepM/ murein hydrolase activator NlpD